VPFKNLLSDIQVLFLHIIICTQRLRFGGFFADIVRSTNLLTYLLTY